MTANTPATRKARGRNLQKQVRDRILEKFPLEEGDVRSTSMGASGEDLLLSPKAVEHFPYSVECKNQEKVRLWEAWEQCKGNATNTPLLIIKRNRSDVLAVLKFEDFLELLGRDNVQE